MSDLLWSLPSYPLLAHACTVVRSSGEGGEGLESSSAAASYV